jgi:hypothetical protein
MPLVTTDLWNKQVWHRLGIGAMTIRFRPLDFVSS